jgi:hypothetical protein
MHDNIFDADQHLGNDSRHGLSTHRRGCGGAAVELTRSAGWSPMHRRRESSA